MSRPNLYRLATSGPLARQRLPEGLEDWAGNPWFVVTGDAALAQALWSLAHGMVILELDDRYPPGSDLDATWRAGAVAFERAVAVSERSVDEFVRSTVTRAPSSPQDPVSPRLSDG
jgi:hypothetical protein